MSKSTMNNLKKIVKERNKTLTSLAVELEVSQEAISQYISGKIKPKTSIIIKMAEILNTSTDYLLNLTDNPCPSDIKLTEDELTLLSNYKNLDEKEKLKVNAYIEAINDLKKC